MWGVILNAVAEDEAKYSLVIKKLNGNIPADFLGISYLDMCNSIAIQAKAEIFDKRNIYWPPTKDHRTIYLVKYTYKNHNEDGSDKIGIGLVGSVTFSLFGLENLLNLKPVEVLAIHCNWELEKENYQDVKSGLDLLKKYTKVKVVFG